MATATENRTAQGAQTADSKPQEQERKELRLFECEETTVRLTVHPGSERQFNVSIKGKGHCTTVQHAMDMVAALEGSTKLKASGKAIKHAEVLNIGNGGIMTRENLLNELRQANAHGEEILTRVRTGKKK